MLKQCLLSKLSSHFISKEKSSKMAEGNRQIAEIGDHETLNGHDVLCYIPVRNLVAARSNPLHLDFNINCRNLPTSWRLDVVYEHYPETGRLFCEVTLNRTDVQKAWLYVIILVSHVDSNRSFVRYPKSVASDQIFAGGKIEGCLEESLHPGLRSYAFNLALVLRVSVFVRYCHSCTDFHAKASSSTGKNKLHRSKL